MICLRIFSFIFIALSPFIYYKTIEGIFIEDVFACEFIESPVPPHFMSQTELSLPLDLEISQVGMTVDNTIKTRFIFEINKGSNKNPAIDVNSRVANCQLPILKI